MRLFVNLLAICALACLAEVSVAEEFVDSVQLKFAAAAGQPTEEEFVLAAKRTYFRRQLSYRVIDGRTVEGIYHDPAKFRYEIRLEEGAVSIVWTGTDKNAKKVDRYLRHLQRDLTYELGKYLL